MEETLVTVAIHTYERAIILKGILESKGIEVCLHNVNLIQPVVSAGVRVRIRESDLPAALEIIEQVDFECDEKSIEKPLPRTILVPVDFSEYTLKAARLAFSIAKSLDANIVLLHTYYSPFYSGGMPISDAFAFDEHSDEAMRSLMQKNEEEMNNVVKQLRIEMASGLLPDVQMVTKFREGVPEEQILLYAKKHKPLLLIMGTKGANSSGSDLLGSVTAEVIDRAPVPVFAFPEQTPFDRFEGIRTVGFLTRFDQRDLVVFNVMMKLLNSLKIKVYFIHISENEDPWDEVQLNGVKEYFKHQYPELQTSYVLLGNKKIVENLNEFIQERNIDILTVASQKRNLFARLFNPGIAHKMVFHGNTPLLVIRG
ncbi:MAG TPA: universal stress protein [Bacteroidales bacterium]|nr:universal stress protein [Bacteroidales bacterium]